MLKGRYIILAQLLSSLPFNIVRAPTLFMYNFTDECQIAKFK